MHALPLLLRLMLLGAVLIILPSFQTQGLQAQSSQAQSPRIRVRVEPDGIITVGQPVTLVVEVLVPSFFTGAPMFPELDVDDAITIFNDRGTNFSEREGGVTWAGQDRSYTIYPQRPGVFEVGEISVEVRYRGEGGSVTAAVSPPQVSFEVRIPSEASGLDHFIAAGSLTMTETFDVKPDTLKVGEAFSRTVRVAVGEALSIVIPPLETDSLPGLAVYPDPPRVEDTVGERGSAIVGTRVESVTYVAEEEGQYTLPALELDWWDVGAERIRRETLPAVSFVVVPNPDHVEEIPLPPDSLDQEVGGAEQVGSRFFLWGMIREWGLPVVLLALGFAIVSRLRRRYGTIWLAGVRKARDRWVESEGVYFRRFRGAARSGDPCDTAQALISWLDRRRPGDGVATFAAFVAEVDDTELSRELHDLETLLYRDPSGEARVRWSGVRLGRSVARARRRRLHSAASQRQAPALNTLNPGSASRSR